MDEKQRCPYEIAVEKYFGIDEYNNMTDEHREVLVGLVCMFDQDKAKHKDAVEYLMHQVEQMRTHQRQYFAHGMTYDKTQAMIMEKKVDKIIIQYKGRGYDGSRFIDKTKQQNLF